jgi:hypothetical protein
LPIICDIRIVININNLSEKGAFPAVVGCVLWPQKPQLGLKADAQPGSRSG